MKIAFVCSEYPPAPHGGIGTFTRSLAEQLTKRGNTCLVIGYDPSVNKTVTRMENDVMVTRLKSPYQNLRGFRLGRYQLSPTPLLERQYLSRQVNRLVREERVDLVESYDWSGPLWSKPPAPLLVRLHGANTAYRVYEKFPVGRLLKYFEGRNVLLADRLVAVSQHIGMLTLQALHLNNLTFDVVYNGVDTSVFHPLDKQRDDLQILYVGSVTRRKGVYELMQAFGLVLKQVPQATLILVGKLPEGQAGKILQTQLLHLLPLEARSQVTFLHHVPYQQIPSLYGQAMLAVFPSHAEAFGLTCIEAMACETPVVMTSRASGPEIVQNGISGLLADPAAPSDLAEKIVKLLKDRILCQQIGAQGRQRVVQHFELEKITLQNIHIYEELVKRSSISLFPDKVI